MSPRVLFEQDLETLKNKVSEMGEHAEISYDRMLYGMRENKEDILKTLLDTDHKMVDMQRSIEAMCLSLLTRQQPVARDMRLVSAALKVVTDIERIGDHVADMVELYLRMGNMNSEGKQEKLLLKMMEEAKDMIHNSVEAFVEGDEANAQKVVEHDDVVDDLFNDMKKEMMQAIREQNLDADRVVDYLMMAKYLEKVGDHAVNIMDDSFKEKNKKINFSNEGKKELIKMYNKVIKIFDESVKTFVNNDKSNMDKINELEDIIDQMQIDYQEGHVERMAAGDCSIEAGLIFTDLVIGLERIADHAVNIAYSILPEKK